MNLQRFSAKKSKQKDNSMKVAKNVVRDCHGQILKITNLATAFEFSDKFLISAPSEKGNKKYLTQNGPSDHEYVESLPSQGLAKMVLPCLLLLVDRMVAEDDAEAKDLLQVIDEFITNLPNHVLERRRKWFEDQAKAVKTKMEMIASEV